MKRPVRSMLYLHALFVTTLLLSFVYEGRSYNGHYLGLERNVCDEEAAADCDYEFLKCKIFTGMLSLMYYSLIRFNYLLTHYNAGPAGDEPTLCRCGSEFWGNCLRKAGCETSRQVDPLSEKLPYMQLCVNHIMQYNCPDVTMCSINCASGILFITSFIYQFIYSFTRPYDR